MDIRKATEQQLVSELLKRDYKTEDLKILKEMLKRALSIQLSYKIIVESLKTVIKEKEQDQ